MLGIRLSIFKKLVEKCNCVKPIQKNFEQGPLITSSFRSAPAKYFANDHDVIFIDNSLICRHRNSSCNSEKLQILTSRATGKMSLAANKKNVNKNYVSGEKLRRRRAK